MSDALMIAGGLGIVAAMAMPGMTRARAVAALAGAAALTGAAMAGAWVIGGLAAALIAVSAVPLAMQGWRRGTVRFSAVEAELRAAHLDGLDAAAARALIDQGHWFTARQGETLTREGESVASLFYVAQGEAQVLRSGRRVGRIGPGELIGEAGVLDDAPATATVVLMRDCRLWFMLAPALRDYVAVHPPVGMALRRSFAAQLRGKLDESNRALADRRD